MHYQKDRLILVLYVDALIAFGQKDFKINGIISSPLKRLKIKYLGVSAKVLGIGWNWKTKNEVIINQALLDNILL